MKIDSNKFLIAHLRSFYMETRFTLHIDPVKVDRDFHMIDQSKIDHQFNPMVTKLEDLGINEKDDMIEPYFIYKHDKLYMFGYCHEYMKSKCYPSTSTLPCFYCTETFTSPPLGIPVKFVNSYLKITKMSDKDGIVTDVKEYIYSEKEVLKLQAKGLPVIKRDYFQVDGNFCSFPCMISYFNKSNSHYYQDSFVI